MRASRLLSILIHLQLRGRTSATELARTFEVSVRTIHRDVDQLSAAGIPIYAERGRDGGFALHDGYQTRLTGFTADEANVLLLAGLGAAAADLGVDSALAAAEAKLAASLPAGAGVRARQTADRFHFDPAEWYRRSEPPSVLPLVAGAVWTERRLRVRYESWKGEVERTLDPLGLVLKAGAWYLVAAVKRQQRTYRVSNIGEAALLDERFERPHGFNLARYWRVRSREFEASLLKETARVRVTARGAKLLAGISEAAGDAIRNTGQGDGAGWIAAEIPIESIEHATCLFLRLGAEAEVLAPAALRKRVLDEAQAVVSMYRPGKAAARRSGPPKPREDG